MKLIKIKHQDPKTLEELIEEYQVNMNDESMFLMVREFKTVIPDHTRRISQLEENQVKFEENQMRLEENQEKTYTLLNSFEHLI